MGRGTKLAIGIILLWFGGFCLFIAFMSGKIDALTTSGGHGPTNASELAISLGKAVQGTEQGGQGAGGTIGNTSGTG